MQPPVAVTSVQLPNFPVSQVDIGGWDLSLLAAFVQVEPLGWMVTAFLRAWGTIADTGSLDLVILSILRTHVTASERSTVSRI